MSSSTTLPALAPRLADYLGTEVARIRVLDSGWETTIYEFTVGARSPRLPELPVNAPMVLRLFDGVRAIDKAAREARMFFYLDAAGYPVPHPYLCEHSRDALGAPFLLMDRVAGGPLFSASSFPLAFKTFSLGFIAFVRAQVRLHRLDASDTAAAGLPRAFANASMPPATSLLDRLLAIIADRVAAGPLPGLNDALTSLRERAARFRDAPDTPPADRTAPANPRARPARSRAIPDSIVHMDYHPQNVIVRGMRVTGVIDWVSADRGDRHLDAATTSAILATSAMDHPRWMRDNAAGNSLRTLFAALYFPTYHALAPMDLERFRYCQAVAGLYRLSTFGMMLTRGPESVGYRPAAIANVTPDVVRLLSRYTSRKSSTPTSLPALMSP